MKSCLSLLLLGITYCESVSQPRSQALSWDTPISLEDIQNIKEEMMKVHTIVVSGHSEQPFESFVPDMNNSQVQNHSATNGEHIDNENVSEISSKDVTSDNKLENIELENNEKLNHSSDYAYRLLSGRERLSPSKLLTHKIDKENSNQEEIDDDIYEVPDASQREEIMKSYYPVTKEHPVFIPDEVKNRSYRNKCDDSPPVSKRSKLSTSGKNSDPEGEESHEEHVDLETMLGTFVDKLIDE